MGVPLLPPGDGTTDPPCVTTSTSRYTQNLTQPELTAIGHVRYFNILTWLRGFQVKLLYLVLFSLYPSLFWDLRDKRNLKNLQFLPESLGAMLEY